MTQAICQTTKEYQICSECVDESPFNENYVSVADGKRSIFRRKRRRLEASLVQVQLKNEKAER